MVDRYWRKIQDVGNDIENSMQTSSILLKLKGYDDKLSDLSKIGNNENYISSNLGKITTNEGNISSNLSKLNNMNIDIRKYIHKKSFIINNMETNSNYKPIFNININFKFTKKGVIKIHANHNYSYTDNNKYNHVYYFFSNNIKFNEIHIDHNSNIVIDNFSIPSIESSKITIIIYLANKNENNSNIRLYDYNTIEIIYNDFVNVSKIDYNIDNISANLGKTTTNEGNISSNLGKITTNEGDISSNLGKITTNEGDISSNLGKITTYEGDISFNLGKINNNKNDILLLQNSNIKAFYNFDKIFINDIPEGDQTVSKNNHYHIFEKEIIYNFIKDSYLEIILEVLTEISNYVLIGFFQILCNFYDENDDLFYTISLSTAMGSINKFSTIKSVFLVPINKSMNKIKIDFFIIPKIGQENRSAKFIIQDINSNKIYIKYYQKTDEMNTKNIEDSLNTVNNFSEKIDENKKDIINLKNNIKLKNIYNILIYDKKTKSILKIYFMKKNLMLMLV